MGVNYEKTESIVITEEVYSKNTYTLTIDRITELISESYDNQHVFPCEIERITLVPGCKLDYFLIDRGVECAVLLVKTVDGKVHNIYLSQGKLEMGHVFRDTNLSLVEKEND